MVPCIREEPEFGSQLLEAALLRGLLCSFMIMSRSIQFPAHVFGMWGFVIPDTPLIIPCLALGRRSLVPRIRGWYRSAEILRVLRVIEPGQGNGMATRPSSCRRKASPFGGAASRWAGAHPRLEGCSIFFFRAFVWEGPDPTTIGAESWNWYGVEPYEEDQMLLIVRPGQLIGYQGFRCLNLSEGFRCLNL